MEIIEKIFNTLLIVWVLAVIVANKWIFRLITIVFLFFILWAILGIARHFGMETTIGSVFN